MADGTLRRPTEHEQAVIVSMYDIALRLEKARLPIAGYAMGPGIIEDKERGRWSVVLGKPVYEVRTDDPLFIGVIVNASEEPR